MANKPEFVDLVSAATRQKYRRTMMKSAAAGPEQKEERRLSHWPPDRVEQWRLVNLTPWKMKLKAWKFKDWV